MGLYRATPELSSIIAISDYTSTSSDVKITKEGYPISQFILMQNLIFPNSQIHYPAFRNLERKEGTASIRTG